MSTPTKSEVLFQRLCEIRSVPCIRIPEGENHVADYQIELGRLKAVVEVKEISPNERDRELIDLESQGREPGRVAPTARVRDLIGTAYKQLKSSCGKSYPGIIVVYNNSPGWNYVDRWTVTNAMFGGYELTIRSNPRGSWDVIRRAFGGKRKATKDQNRAITALCVLEEAGNSELRIVAYHNPYARKPIPPEKLELLAEEQYMHPDPHVGQYVDWEPIKIEQKEAHDASNRHRCKP